MGRNQRREFWPLSAHPNRGVRALAKIFVAADALLAHVPKHGSQPLAWLLEEKGGEIGEFLALFGLRKEDERALKASLERLQEDMEWLGVDFPYDQLIYSFILLRVILPGLTH